ncbi:MAG: efflux RND transporter periplasmic adaptor subunit [Candidatus Margulisiibacteriota bacterium]|mgnify:CR=1 FL=1
METKNKNRLKWGVGIAAAIILAWGFASYMKSGIKIKTAKAAVGTIKPAVSVSGEINGREADLSPKIMERISWIGVKEGDRVSAGQILAKLDNYESAKREYDGARSLFASGFATKQQLDNSRLQYESSCFISPINGVVTLVANKVGESVSPGIASFSIVSPSSAYAEVQIDESDIGDVSAGKDVIIYADAYPDITFAGTLVNIGQEAELKKIGGRIKMDEEDKIFRGRAAFKDPEYKLKIGMTINADIVIEKKNGVLVIPREAVLNKGGKTFVYLVKGGRVKEVKIETGLKDSANVEVKSALKAGDQVASSSFDKLKNNSKVIIEK